MEVGKKLGLKGGDTMLMTIEEDRVVLEKNNVSPVDDAFGIWPEIQDSVEFVNQLRSGKRMARGRTYKRYSAR